MKTFFPQQASKNWTTAPQLPSPPTSPVRYTNLQKLISWLSHLFTCSFCYNSWFWWLACCIWSFRCTQSGWTLCCHSGRWFRRLVYWTIRSGWLHCRARNCTSYFTCCWCGWCRPSGWWTRGWLSCEWCPCACFTIRGHVHTIWASATVRLYVNS